MLKKIINGILNFLHLIKDEGEKALHIANEIVNKILAFEQTPIGQELETIIEGVIPADLKAAFILWLPTFLKALRWAEGELDKSDDDILKDGLGYVKSLTGDVKVYQANTLAAGIGKFISDNTGGGLTAQQTTTFAQPVHAPILG